MEHLLSMAHCKHYLITYSSFHPLLRRLLGVYAFQHDAFQGMDSESAMSEFPEEIRNAVYCSESQFSGQTGGVYI